MDPFVDQLKDCCRRFPTRSKWVFVPTHAVGHTLGERLVFEGTNWLNLRFVTPLDIALRMGAPFLVERGIAPSEEELGPALMMRLMLDLPAQGGYFRPLAGHPTLAQALWSTVRELRMAGLSAKELKGDAFSSLVKHAELVALMGRYQAFLVERNRADMATVYHEAMSHLDWCPIQAADVRTELPGTTWTPLQRRLIDALPGEVMAPRAYELAGLNLPRRFEKSPVIRVAPAAETAPLANLMAPAASPANTNIALFHAGGREAETEEVFRHILVSGSPLDQVEIACATDAHVPLIWDIDVLPEPDGKLRVKVKGGEVSKPQLGKVEQSSPDELECWFIYTDYNEASFFVRHAYFLGANDTYSALKTTLNAEIDQEAWASLDSDTSRPFEKPKNGRIAVKVINHLGDEVMKVFRVQ